MEYHQAFIVGMLVEHDRIKRLRKKLKRAGVDFIWDEYYFDSESGVEKVEWLLGDTKSSLRKIASSDYLISFSKEADRLEIGYALTLDSNVIIVDETQYSHYRNSVGMNVVRWINEDSIPCYLALDGLTR